MNERFLQGPSAILNKNSILESIKIIKNLSCAAVISSNRDASFKYLRDYILEDHFLTELGLKLVETHYFTNIVNEYMFHQSFYSHFVLDDIRQHGLNSST